jgi:hypothetical protein
MSTVIEKHFGTSATLPQINQTAEPIFWAMLPGKFTR